MRVTEPWRKFICLAVGTAAGSNLRVQRFEEAQRDFSRYEQLLPGNPDTGLLNGLALERLGR
ncbi:MAG: hypothetical protein ACUVWX_02595 [Kiritimatiellia bacterium]